MLMFGMSISSINVDPRGDCLFGDPKMENFSRGDRDEGESPPEKV
jgi:hypothetical protein